MLRKEIIETARMYFWISLIYLAYPVLYLMDQFIFTKFSLLPYSFLQFFTAATYIFAIMSGLAIFQSEKKDHAWEYYLSLPISSGKKLLDKTLPRLAVLFLHIAVISIIAPSFPLRTIFNLILLFFVPMFLSLAVDSILTSLLGVFMLYSFARVNELITHHLMGKYLPGSGDTRITILSLIVSALLTLVPLGISFWWTFKKLDLKPMKLQLYPYYYVFMPVLLLNIAFVIITFNKVFT